MPTLYIKSLMCINPDEIDKDEVFLKMKGKRIWPQKGKYKKTDSGDKLPVEVTVEAENGMLDIELWDYDMLSFNDKLGTFSMMIDDERGISNTAAMKKDGAGTASYLLEWMLK